MPRYIDIEPFETDSSHDWFLIGYRSTLVEEYASEIDKKDITQGTSLLMMELNS